MDNDNHIDIVDIVGDNLPSRYIENYEYDSYEENFEQYIEKNDTIENKLFEFNYNKLNFSFENKTFNNCHFYNYKSFSETDNVTNSNFINCRFNNINFLKAIFHDNTFENCVFDNINFEDIQFKKCNMAGSKFSNCNFATGNIFNLCDMAGIEFNSCYMAGCNFTESNVSECNFYNCIINYKIFENSYIIIGDRRVVLKGHILRHIDRYGDYTGKIRHLSLESIGNVIEKKIQEFIKTTKEELASKNINDYIAEIVIDNLFPIEQRSRSRYREHSKLSVRNNKNNRNTSRSRSRDRPRTSHGRSRDRPHTSRGGKGKKTRKIKNK
jgi:uncharacterized protein YjbI with pentapeptide repeats